MRPKALAVLVPAVAIVLQAGLAPELRKFNAAETIAQAEVSDQESPQNQAPPALPGKGLAQHPFLYCGEWDTRKPIQTMYIVKDGRVAWSYSVPNKDELDDIHMLSNGNILYARKGAATEITHDKKIVWNYEAPPGTEVHYAQPVGNDKVLFMQNGIPAKLILMNKVSGKIEMEHVLATARPKIQRACAVNSRTFE